MRAGQIAFCKVRGDHLGQNVRAHREFGVERNEAQVVPAEAGQQRALVDRAMRMRRHIDARLAGFALQSAARQRISRRPLARADERDQCAGRRGILNDAAPGRREPEHLPQPIDDDLFDFGQRRARLPGEPEHAEPSADEIAENARRQGVGGEVAEETRMLPKRQSRQDDAVEIVDHRAEVLRLARRLFRQGVAHLAGPGRGHHRPLGQAFMVVGQPVDEPVAVAAEFLRRQGLMSFSGRCSSEPASRLDARKSTGAQDKRRAGEASRS